jgi:hypothetical protein
MRLIITFLIILGPFIFLGQKKLLLKNQSNGKTIKLKKRHNLVCTTLEDKSFSGDLKTFDSTSLTLKLIRPTDSINNRFVDTVIKFSDIVKLTYTRYSESSFIGGLLWYGGILGPAAIIVGTAVVLDKDETDKRPGLIIIGAGVLLTSGAIYSAVKSGPINYNLITDWKIRTK